MRVSVQQCVALSPALAVGRIVGRSAGASGCTVTAYETDWIHPRRQPAPSARWLARSLPAAPTTRLARAPADHDPIRGLEQACSDIVVKSRYRHRLHPVQTACNGAYLRGGSNAPAALHTIDSTVAMCRQQPAAECPHLLTTVPMHARDVDALSEWRVFLSTEMSKPPAVWTTRSCLSALKGDPHLHPRAMPHRRHALPGHPPTPAPNCVTAVTARRPVSCRLRTTAGQSRAAHLANDGLEHARLQVGPGHGTAGIVPLPAAQPGPLQSSVSTPDAHLLYL